MAGTIFGLPLSQQLDQETGEFLSGGLLYLYDANTTTPVTVYQDFDLSTEHQFPIELDAGGRIPEFWLDDGQYRVVLRNSDGVSQFDIAQTTALGPSSGTSSGTSVPATSIHQTGDFIWNPVSGSRSAWVRANARTIGSASSGASERANADCEDLFLFLWNNFTDAICPVTGGRGANAATDWTANKKIATPDMRGRAPFGLDDMGNSAASVLVVGTPTAAATSIGAEKTTVLQANLPSVNLTHSLSVSTTLNNGSNVTRGLSIDNDDTVSRGTGSSFDFTKKSKFTFSNDTVSLNSGTVSGTVALGGSGTAATTVSPGRLGSWYIKL